MLTLCLRFFVFPVSARVIPDVGVYFFVNKELEHTEWRFDAYCRDSAYLRIEIGLRWMTTGFLDRIISSQVDRTLGSPAYWSDTSMLVVRLSAFRNESLRTRDVHDTRL